MARQQHTTIKQNKTKNPDTIINFIKIKNICLSKDSIKKIKRQAIYKEKTSTVHKPKMCTEL